MEYQLEIQQGRALVRLDGVLDSTLETDESWRELGRAIVDAPVVAGTPLYVDFRSVDRLSQRGLHDLRRLIQATGRSAAVVFVGPGTGAARLAELGGGAELPEFIAAPPWESGQDPRSIEEILERALPDDGEVAPSDPVTFVAADLDSFIATPVDTRASTKIEEFVIDLDLERLYLEHQSDSREIGKTESEATLFFGSNWKPIRSSEPKSEPDVVNTTLWEETPSEPDLFAKEERVPVLAGEVPSERDGDERSASCENAGEAIGPASSEVVAPDRDSIDEVATASHASKSGVSATTGPAPTYEAESNTTLFGENAPSPTGGTVSGAAGGAPASCDSASADSPTEAAEAARVTEAEQPAAEERPAAAERIAAAERAAAEARLAALERMAAAECEAAAEHSAPKVESPTQETAPAPQPRAAGLGAELSELRDQWDLLQHRFDFTEPSLRRLMATVRGLVDRHAAITASLGAWLAEEREGPRGDRWCATLIALATWSTELIAPNALAARLRTLILTSCSEQRRSRPRLGWCHAELEKDALELERTLSAQREAAAVDEVVELWRGAVAASANPQLSGATWRQAVSDASRYLDGQPEARNGLARVVRTLGYWLPGSWVELSSGECGVVLPRSPGTIETPVNIFFRHGRATAPRRFPDTHDVGITITGPIDAPTLVS
ncbi:MAG: hypothetical protein AAF488_01535 [Planctomycetota bacterium]